MTKNDFIRLGSQLKREAQAAHDLATWLPSYKCAQKHHGDYAYDFISDVDDVLEEASMLLAEVCGYGHTDEEWVEWARCCDEHRPTAEEARGYVQQCMESKP